MSASPAPPDPATSRTSASDSPTAGAARADGTPAWTDGLLQNPHAVSDKAARVNKMFAAIAPSYDLNNRLHSLWMDQHWRNVAVKMAGVNAGDRIVDVACGTGDLTLKFARHLAYRGRLGQSRIMGIDFTDAMLPIAQAKSDRHQRHWQLHKGKTPWPVSFIHGNALALPLDDSSVDIVSIAFGIRNVADWGRAIDEFARVLKPGGRLVILEFSLPTNRVLRALYNFYFRRVLPRTATWISGDKTGAYKYLPESVNTFISREAMIERMAAAGFDAIKARTLTFGVCLCYKGVRR
jgi:demethylmenaquinone methyltransferase / 2-methoxy-6-polyprenyl-1,4-benzoquinol methylase